MIVSFVTISTASEYKKILTKYNIPFLSLETGQLRHVGGQAGRFQDKITPSTQFLEKRFINVSSGFFSNYSHRYMHCMPIVILTATWWFQHRLCPNSQRCTLTLILNLYPYSYSDWCRHSLARW